MDDRVSTRERKADIEQVVERLLRETLASQVAGVRRPCRPQRPSASLSRDFAGEDPLVLVANDVAPADMMHFKRSVFTGFVTDVGGPHLAHGHRGAQHGHPGRGGRARSQPADPPGRLGGDRW